MKMVNGSLVGQNFAIMNVKSGFWEDENLEYISTIVCQQVYGKIPFKTENISFFIDLCTVYYLQ